MIRALVRLWRGVPEWMGPRIDVAAKWANDTHREDEQEWRYDNREQAHMRSGCWCGSPNEVRP